MSNFSNGDIRIQHTPLVIDLSHDDGVGSFVQSKSAGLVGVIHKATTGATGRDDMYAGRRQQALAAGLLWGAYHWGTSADAKEQADNFMAWAKPDANTLIALDLEATPGNQMTLAIAKQFCQVLFDRLGRRPVIYSGDTLKDDLGTSVDPFFTQHRLWLAQYGASPKVQCSWDNFWLWQYTDGDEGPSGCRAVPGILGDSKKRIDCNYFAGDAATLAAQWAS
ncbi:glycoside hydrolase family 25 protein [Pseudomonas syringae]|uniref:glycoside hydrolase family 25 protein n=1 Tax=Pseudomonas syringae TaxID=317 RepID=UPI0020BDA2D2|nr:glycoside hydrolase family 25 protein [Pseudomonas syringae]MCL6309714.1 glycoside hydrolase family 25 protein [Pseudomonas syringae]